MANYHEMDRAALTAERQRWNRLIKSFRQRV